MERRSGRYPGRESAASWWRRPLQSSDPPRFCYFVAALDEGLRLMELPRVDQFSDVARQFAEEEDRLDLLHYGRLLGGGCR